MRLINIYRSPLGIAVSRIELLDKILSFFKHFRFVFYFDDEELFENNLFENSLTEKS